MGRRRKNELKPGDNVTIYIPQDVEREVLHFMRTQANLSKTVFRILESYVMRKTRDYIDFDDLYNERSSDLRNFNTEKSEGASLNNELKDFIKNTINNELSNILNSSNTSNSENISESEIESKHEEKIKKVQNLIESEEENSQPNIRDMDDLFSEFSKTIEDESTERKKLEVSKNHLWEYGDDD